MLVTDARMFAGLMGTAAAATDVNPSTLTNILGVGCDAGDTTLQLYAAGAAAQTRVDLGVNFPVNTTGVDVYELALYAPPNGSEVRFQVTRLNTGNVTSGVITVSANLPAATVLMAPYIWRTNNATAAACSFDWTSLYIETEV